MEAQCRLPQHGVDLSGAETQGIMMCTGLALPLTLNVTSSDAMGGGAKFRALACKSQAASDASAGDLLSNAWCWVGRWPGHMFHDFCHVTRSEPKVGPRST